MNRYYKQLLFIERKVNALSMRERCLLLLSSLGIIFYLWQTLIFDTMFGSQEKIANNIKLVQQQANQLTTQVNSIYNLIKSDPKKKLSERITHLKKEQHKFEGSINSITKKLIPPNEMPKLLEEILSKNKELTFVSLKNIMEEPIFKPNNTNKKTDANEKELDHVQLYKHGIVIELIGSYFATKNFLQELETLQWQLLWDKLEYEVKEHPYASVKIVIYTLSLHKSYIGT